MALCTADLGVVGRRVGRVMGSGMGVWGGLGVRVGLMMGVGGGRVMGLRVGSRMWVGSRMRAVLGVRIGVWGGLGLIMGMGLRMVAVLGMRLGAVLGMWGGLGVIMGMGLRVRMGAVLGMRLRVWGGLWVGMGGGREGRTDPRPSLAGVGRGARVGRPGVKDGRRSLWFPNSQRHMRKKSVAFFSTHLITLVCERWVDAGCGGDNVNMRNLSVSIALGCIPNGTISPISPMALVKCTTFYQSHMGPDKKKGVKENRG